MPLPRFQRLPAERRARLLDAAAEEFSGRGYEGASLNRILAAAGLGKSSYYYYFADKEDLYATVIEQAMDRLEAHLPPVPDGGSASTFWGDVEAHFAAAVAAAARDPKALALFRTLHRVRQDPGPRIRPIFDRARGQYRAIIDAGRRLSCVRTDLGAEELVSLLDAIDAALDERLFAREGRAGPAELKTHARLVLDTWRRLLEPPGTSRGSSAG